MRTWVLAAMAALSLVGAARAEVVETGAQGFRLKAVRQINAPPARVTSPISRLFSSTCWSGACQLTRKSSTLAPSKRPAARSPSAIASLEKPPATSPAPAPSPVSPSLSLAEKPLAAR